MVLESVSSLLKELDFIGPTIGLEKNSSKIFKTIPGAFLSLASFGVIFFITMMFGQEIYQRQLPTISNSQAFRTYSDLPVSEFPIWFDLYFTSGVEISDIFDYISWDISTIVVPAVGNLYIDFNHTMELCNGYSRFTDYQAYVPTQVKLSWCFHDDGTVISNDLFATNSTALRIELYKCNPNIRTCAADLDTAFDQLVLVIGTITSFVQTTNYTTPVSFTSESITLNLSNNLAKNINYGVVFNNFKADNGWIFSDVNDIVYFTTLDLQYQYQVVDSNDGSEKLSIQFFSPRLIQVTERTYMKVQELFAKIGGIANAITLMATAISYHYLRFKYLLAVRDYSIQDYENNSFIQSNYKQSKYTLNDDQNLQKQKIPENLDKKNNNLISSKVFASKFIISQNQNVQDSMTNEQGKLNKSEIKELNLNQDKEKPKSLSDKDVLKIQGHSLNQKDFVNKKLETENNNIIKVSTYKSDFRNKTVTDLRKIDPEKILYCYYLSSFFCNKELKSQFKIMLNSAQSVISFDNYCKFVVDHKSE